MAVLVHRLLTQNGVTGECNEHVSISPARPLLKSGGCFLGTEGAIFLGVLWRQEAAGCCVPFTEKPQDGPRSLHPGCQASKQWRCLDMAAPKKFTYPAPHSKTTGRQIKGQQTRKGQVLYTQETEPWAWVSDKGTSSDSGGSRETSAQQKQPVLQEVGARREVSKNEEISTWRPGPAACGHRRAWPCCAARGRVSDAGSESHADGKVSEC